MSKKYQIIQQSNNLTIEQSNNLQTVTSSDLRSMSKSYREASPSHFESDVLSEVEVKQD